MKLVVIDPNVTSGSPSLRGWIDAFDSFRPLFDEVEIWASECSIPESPGVSWRRFPRRMPTWTLHGYDFERRMRRLWSQAREDPHVIVQTTGCIVPRADIRYMQFWNRALLEEETKRKSTFELGFRQKVFANLAAKTERRVAEDMNSTSWWWVASRSLAERIASEGAGGHFRVLPNQYDPGKFNLDVRARWRNPMREHYGFGEHERVFVFSAFGHFERKGLLQAAEAISILRREGYPVRLLILGGIPKTVTSFQKKMRLAGVSEEGCEFAGMVDNIERHLSAADAFFFPSHFEAFSLSEIEAAALGLRLYLTPHFGSEMILREPTNGRILPWDSAGMARVIAEDLRTDDVNRSHHELAEALTPGLFRNRLIELYSEIISSKRSPF